MAYVKGRMKKWFREFEEQAIGEPLMGTLPYVQFTNWEHAGYGPKGVNPMAYKEGEK